MADYMNTYSGKLFSVIHPEKDSIDVVDIAHKVSREIEHSDVNLVRLEKICEKMPMFSTEELLRVVLSVILLEG